MGQGAAREAFHTVGMMTVPNRRRARDLQRTRYSAAYSSRLRQGLNLLREWACDRGLTLRRLVKDVEKMNFHLAAFVQWGYETGKNFHLIKHSVLAVQTEWPSLHLRLRLPWQSLRSWLRELPVQNRTPLTLHFLNVLCPTALICMQGAPDRKGRYLWRALSTLLRVGFHALLRPGEAFGLYVEDILFGHEAGEPTVVIIRKPKNRFHMGRIQHAVIQDPRTISWLTYLVGQRSSGKLWPATLQKARDMFKHLLQLRQLAGCNLTLSSCRAGGATHRYLQGEDVSKLRFAGRWANDNTMRAYIQEAAATLVSNQLSRAHAQALRDFEAATAFLQWPPPQQ